MYYYQVQISLNSDFTDIIVNTVVENVSDYTVIKDLEHFTVYWWRVKTIDPLTGAKSEWSVPCAFRIKAEDVTIHHDIDFPTDKHSYIWYGSECFGLEHKFVRDYDIECVIPDAQIGVGLCNTSAVAEIGTGFCPGVCLPEFDGFDIEYILTEDNLILRTEDEVGLILEF